MLISPASMDLDITRADNAVSSGSNYPHGFQHLAPHPRGKCRRLLLGWNCDVTWPFLGVEECSRSSRSRFSEAESYFLLPFPAALVFGDVATELSWLSVGSLTALSRSTIKHFVSSAFVGCYMSFKIIVGEDVVFVLFSESLFVCFLSFVWQE